MFSIDSYLPEIIFCRTIFLEESKTFGEKYQFFQDVFLAAEGEFLFFQEESCLAENVLNV